MCCAIFCPPERFAIYDTVGMFGLLVLVFLGWRISEPC